MLQVTIRSSAKPVPHRLDYNCWGALLMSVSECSITLQEEKLVLQQLVLPT